MTRIALVGAGGYVGSRFVELSLLRGGFETVPIVRSLSGAVRLARFGSAYRIADADGDITAAIEDCDAVVNLTQGDPTRILPQLQNIHGACQRAGVQKLVHLSSAVVFGDASGAIPPSSQPAQPMPGMQVYANQKAIAEQWLHSQDSGPLSVVTLRPGLVWGPRSPWVVRPLSALSADTAFLVRGGSGVCNLIYVDNLIHSVLAVINDPEQPSGFYNVADDCSITWREYYAALGTLVGRPIEAVVDIGDAAFKPSLYTRIRESSHTWWFRRAKALLGDNVKDRVKAALAPADGDAHQPRIPKPEITRDIWSLQRTTHRLSTDDFAQRFNYTNPVTFETAMERTAEWARFAGFARDAQLTATPSSAS